MIVRPRTRLSCMSLLLLLQATFFSVNKAGVVVSARSENSLRGFNVNENLLDELPHRELPEISATKKNKQELKNGKKEPSSLAPKDIKDKGPRNGFEKIHKQEEIPSGGANKEKEMGRDDIQLPTTSSDSNWSLTTSQELSITESPTVELTASDPSNSIPLPSFKETEQPTSLSTFKPTEVSEPTSSISETEDDYNSVVTERPSAKNSSQDLTTDNIFNNQVLDVEFDENVFTAKERLQPVTLNMTVSNLSMMNYDKLRSYFKKFIEDLLSMRSDRDWYPFHSKSVHNISIELVPDEIVKGYAEDNIRVQLIISGDVFVHVKKQEVGKVTSSTRIAGGAEKESAVLSDNASLFTLHDSFYHSMLLYFTFWGVESLQQNLEDHGGLQNPNVVSVSIGKQELMTFGIEKKHNYLYSRGDHGSTKLKHLPSSSIVGIGSNALESSASSSRFGLFTIVMVSVGIII